MLGKRSRHGLTLIEMIAALSLVGFALLGSQLLLDQLGDSTRRIAAAGETASREGNGERLLRRLLRDAQAWPDSASRFRGDVSTITYVASCPAAGGWTERCRVRLLIDARDDSSAVLADLPRGTREILHVQAGRAAFRYLQTIATDSAWVSRWGESIALPLAVAIASNADTAIYMVGPSRE